MHRSVLCWTTDYSYFNDINLKAFTKNLIKEIRTIFHNTTPHNNTLKKNYNLEHIIDLITGRKDITIKNQYYQNKKYLLTLDI